MELKEEWEIRSNQNFIIYSKNIHFEKYGDLLIYFEGYFLPRNDCFNLFNELKGAKLIFELFNRFGYDFIQKIKGFFVILIITGDNFYLYNDIHSVKRFFYKSGGTDYLISNDINLLGSLTNYQLEPSFAANHALFQHFVFGKTIFRNIKYSDYATFSCLEKGRLRFTRYWNTTSLFQNTTDQSQKDFSRVFNESVGNYLKFFKPASIAATITGGRDTRSVLASLMANRAIPLLFTFGNPQNRDVVVGKMIAKKCNLPFFNPDISNPDPDEYSYYLKKLINLENPFIHLHRTHRLQAIESVTENGKIEMVFVGAMGGDYIKGTSFDDYIVSKFVNSYFFARHKNIKELIREILTEHFVEFDDGLLVNIESQIFSNAIFTTRDFNSLKDLLISHDIVGCTHDIQDISVFSEYADRIIAPFMDLDVMEALFRTKFSLLFNSKNSSRLFTKYLGGELQAKLVFDLCPELSGIPYANYYTPEDIIGSKAKYVFKRTMAFLKQKRNKNVSGFEYGNWFVDLVKNELLEKDHTLISEFYNVRRIKYSFGNSSHLKHEGYWHKFSNPMMFRMYMEKLII